jgi:hypothetical protein
MLIYARLAAFASRIGLTGLAIAVLVSLLAVQTARIEGFKVWPLSIEGWKPKAERFENAAKGCETRHAATRSSLEQLQARLAAMIADGKAREKRQQEAVEAQERVSAALDNQIDRIRRERGAENPSGAQETGAARNCQSPVSVLEAEGL